MSETTGARGDGSSSAPGAAAPAAPAPTGQLGITPPSAAPATSQPGISVSEAARLLGRQRRQGRAQGADASAEAATPAEARKPSANELAAASRAPQANDNRAAANENVTTKPAPTGASALERALGVPEGTAPAAAEPSDGAIIEIEGQRLRTLDEVREFARKKSAHFTQQMQELSEGRRQVQAQQEALATVLPYIQPELARLGQAIQQPQRPDPAQLESDPQGYLRARAAYENAMEEQQRLGSLNALQSQAANRAMEQQVAAANEQLAKEIEGWSDPRERGALQQEIVDWATTKGGFSHAELHGLSSPHHLKTMMKAAMYDKMVSGARSSAPPQRLAAPVRGAPPPPAPTERIQQAEQAFGERANIRTAAALLAARRGNGQAR